MPNWSRIYRGLRLLPVFCCSALASSAHGAMSGSLETRFQADSYFDPGNYLEQWLTLDYRIRDDSMTWGMLGNYGVSSTESWMKLHRLFVERSFFEDRLSAKAGRFERIDAAGFYTLDGLEARWKDSSGRRWNLFAGKPGRAELYSIPGRDEEVNRPESKYLLGVNMSRSLPADDYHWLDKASVNLGLRYHFSGADSWKLDGGFSAGWRPTANMPAIMLDAAMVVDVSDGLMESFDVQARTRIDERRQLWLRGRRYDPPDTAVSFEERFYRYYARGWQTALEAGYREQHSASIKWGAGLRTVTRELGVQGAGVNLDIDWQPGAGTLWRGRIEWLGGDGEHAAGLLLGHERPLNSRLLLQVNTALRDERSRLDGSRRVAAGELRLDWMWSRDLRLSGMLELTHSRSDLEDYEQIRFGLRLVYQLPARGAEDYR